MEAAPTPNHLVIDHPENAATHEDSSGFRSNIFNIADAYLRGKPIFIQCATLRGPFDAAWKNPWSFKAKRRKLPPHVDRPTNEITCFSTEGGRNRGLEDRKTIGGTSKRVDSSSPSGALPSGVKRQRTRGQPHICHPRWTQRQAETDRIKNKALVENKVRRDDKRSRFASLSPRISRREDVGNAGVAITESGQKDQWQDTGSPPAFATSARAAEAPINVIQAVDTQVNHDTSRQREKPALKRRLQRDQTKPSVKKTCSWCKTDESYQWRRGPHGPATLCSSCGAKCTHQQRKARERATASVDGQTRDPPRVRSAEPASSHTRRLSKLPAADSRSHAQICQKMFPDTEVCNAILSNNASRLEELHHAEVINLRGQHSPSMRKWDETPLTTGLDPESCQVLKSNLDASPRRRAPDARDGPSGEVQRTTSLPKLPSKKRKVLTFDTPQIPTRKTSTKAAQPSLKNEPIADLPQSQSVLLGHANSGERESLAHDAVKSPSQEPAHQDALRASMTPGVVAAVNDASSLHRRRSAKVRYSELSTQAALVQAQKAFQDNLHSFDTPILTGSRTYLETPPTFNTPQRSPIRPSSRSNQQPMCTQDLFDQTLDFGTPSPTRKSQAVTQHTQLSCVSEKDTPQNVSGLKDEDLPTSPPSSQPEFDTTLSQPDNTEGSTRQSFSTIAEPRLLCSPCSPLRQPSPPLFSSATKLMNHAPFDHAKQSTKDNGLSQGIDVDQVIAQAGSFLDTWRT